MKVFRLQRGQDLYESIKLAANKDSQASHVICTCVGSLNNVILRMAGATKDNQNIKNIEGPFEIVSLTGTISKQKPHIHISVSNSSGNVIGGHLMPGSIVNTTAEICLLDTRVLGNCILDRKHDLQTGFSELTVESLN